MNNVVQLIEINKTNKQWVNKIKANTVQRPLLHYNAYWYGQSMLVNDIDCFLIAKGNDFVGFVVFGQYYKDEYLQEKENYVAEIIHLVIDEKFQKQGIGNIISKKIIQRLKSQNFTKIYIAVDNKNNLARKFWSKLKFEATDFKNYDGDEIFEYKK